MAQEMVHRGVRRIHVLGWRDLGDPDAGGSEVHADAFMSRWHEVGFDVVHRTSSARNEPSEVERNGYRVVRRGSRLGVFPRTIAAEVFGRMGPYDALVEIWNGVPWLSPLWCRKPRVVVLHHVHDRMWNQILPGPAAWFGRKLETTLAPPLYRRAETVTLCEDSRSDLLGLGWNSSNVHIAYAGLDSFFAPGGTKTEHPSVIAVGRLAPVKRLPDLLEQFRIVHERVPDASLTIVGEGPERSRLENWIASHGAHSWIRLLGRVDKETLRSLYQSSWLITSASLAEGWGMTLTEAAGCGTPAVATDIGGHRSSVRRGVTGTLVDLNELGEAMIEILEDDVRRRRMADESLRWARSLSWDELATRVLRPLYRQVVSR